MNYVVWANSSTAAAEPTYTNFFANRQHITPPFETLAASLPSPNGSLTEHLPTMTSTPSSTPTPTTSTLTAPPSPTNSTHTSSAGMHLKVFRMAFTQAHNIMSLSSMTTRPFPRLTQPLESLIIFSAAYGKRWSDLRPNSQIPPPPFTKTKLPFSPPHRSKNFAHICSKRPCDQRRAPPALPIT